MNATNQRIKVRVGKQAAELRAMSCANHGNTSLRNAAHSSHFLWTPNLIHHNHLQIHCRADQQEGSIYMISCGEFCCCCKLNDILHARYCMTQDEFPWTDD